MWRQNPDLGLFSRSNHTPTVEVGSDIYALDQGTRHLHVVVLDESDASLHPRVSGGSVHLLDELFVGVSIASLTNSIDEWLCCGVEWATGEDGMSKCR